MPDLGHQFPVSASTDHYPEPFDAPHDGAAASCIRPILIEALEGAIKVLEMAETYNQSHIFFTEVSEPLAVVTNTTPDWDRDTGNGFNERGYSAGHGIYHDPMG